MSSTSELQCSPSDFLRRWMPSSTRAGVILGPSPELAASLPPAPPHPDDSFSSDFAPLPASADSSCIDAGEGTRAASSPAGVLDGRLKSMEEMASKTQDLPLMVKLEELRRWQQLMHDQLKAHQLEELLRLQEEQQRLLGMGNVSQIRTGGRPRPPGARRQNDSFQQSPGTGVCGVRKEQQVSPESREDQLSACEEDEGEENPKSISEADVTLMPPEPLHDRPIKPGIGGQTKTFEELLEEELRLEEQRLKSAQHQSKRARPDAAVPPKRPFLKRGEGLSRFSNSSKAPAHKAKDKMEQKLRAEARAIACSNSAPGSILNGVPPLPVKRKTAVLDKENRLRGPCSPPHYVRAESEAQRILGSHQRQNTGPAVIQTEPEARKVKEKEVGGVLVQVVRNTDPNLRSNAATKQRGVVAMLGDEKKLESAELNAGGGTGSGLPRDSFELLFQEKLQKWECNRQLESMELGEFELLEQAAEELSFSSNSSFVMKVLHLDQQKRLAAIGLHNRRLSSTPIKSASGSESQKSADVQLPDGSGDALRAKANGENGDEISDSSSESADSEVPFEEMVCFSAPSNPTYDKRSYQDEDSLGDSASDGFDEDEESVSPADSTLTDDTGGQQAGFVFDDDDTWNDLDYTAVSKEGDSREVGGVPQLKAGGVSPPEKTMLRKVAVSRAVELNDGPVAEPPQASQLMTRLFPSLKPKAQSAPLPVRPAASENNETHDDTAQQAQSRQLRERLVELEIEIERFKKENAALAKLRQESEKSQEVLRKERLEFEQAKAEELAKFEEYKKEENRKLQKERKLFEKHATAARAIPDKKEREEIQSLKQELNLLQEELRRRESRWASTHGRLRQQIDSLNQENGSLRDEIRTLEKLRLSSWKKSSVSTEKAVQTRDGPRTSVSSAASVTKGVKFATPLNSRGSMSSPPLSSAARRNATGSGSAASAIKSSLRTSAGSGSTVTSTSLGSSGSRVKETPRPASKSQEKPCDLKLDHSQSCSPRTDLVAEQHSSESNQPEPAQDDITHPDGKVEKVLANGDRLVVFPNGTRKEVSADGSSTKVTFFNGDTKQITADQRVIYYYAEAHTTHITYPDGMEVLHFPNNQTEKHFPDRRKEITFPDQTVKNLFPDGREESVLTDGTVIQVNPDGTKEIHFNTGQKETHTAEYKRREYPDGTVKTIYSDGRQETRYPTGRLRVKDRDGNVILDNHT